MGKSLKAVDTVNHIIKEIKHKIIKTNHSNILSYAKSKTFYV